MDQPTLTFSVAFPIASYTHAGGYGYLLRA